jgi:phytoene dehydrogenase-like protein
VEAEGQILEHLEPYLRETEPDGAAAMLSLVALDEIKFDPDELSASVRRALLVLAAGGDLRRELTADDPAVARLAEDLDDPDRRAELATALQQLRALAADLPAAAATLDALLADTDRAWRALATAILADELTDD